MGMFDGLLQGFVTAVSWHLLPYLLVGAAIGLVIGIIPGLSGHFAMAMMIPFVFRMDAAVGVTFILAAHAAVAQGGGVTAILFATPGTGQNAATLLDGPAMTEKGEAGRAVGAAMTACFLGAFFGVFVLTVLLPILRRVVLMFGPPEFFMLAVLALTFIAVLGTGGNINKGLIAGALGLLFSFVGVGNVTGERRFTFGLLQLWDGLAMVPVLLGIFAVSEMLDLWIEGGSLARKAGARHSGSMQRQIFRGVMDTLRRWWLVIRCSAIGTTMGLIPGLGSAPAAFVAYAHAKQTSRNPEKFGTGTIEGVISPESANDAVEGGALASTLAFGIPGSSSMAILITALIILGVEPGPKLMAQNLDLVFLMIWTVVIGNFFGTLMGMVVANPLARVTFLRGSLLVPVLLTIILTGSFVVHSVWFDMIVALVFGLLGYAMKKMDYSRPAFIIGFVLGLMVERNLYLSVKLYGSTFFLQPLALGLLMLTIAVLLYNVRKLFKGRKAEYLAAADAKEKASVQTDLSFCLLLLVLLAVFFVAALGYKPVARRAPLIAMIPLAVMLLGQGAVLARKLKQTQTQNGQVSLWPTIETKKLGKGIRLLIWMILLMLMIYLAGHAGGTALFLILFLVFASHERWVLSISLSVGVTVSLYLLFEVILKITLYPGVIYEYLTALVWS